MLPVSRGWRFPLSAWKLRSRTATFRQYAKASTSLPGIAPEEAPPIKIRLREYQEECIQAVLTHLDQGHKRLGISLATGSGKTVIFTQLIDRVKPHTELADQTLILAHRKELVEQAARHCKDAYPMKKIEVEMSSMHASGSADITVASIQSILSGDRILKFNPKRFKLVLVDEAHHIVSAGYLKAMEYFGLSKKQPDSPALVGVSATLSRFDGLRLGAAIDQIVYHKDYIDMIGDKWLADVNFTTVHSKADLSKVGKGANGDFHPSELSGIVNTDEINKITVGSWLAKAQGRKSTLTFCVDLAHVEGLTNAFRKQGIDARFITGETPKLERSVRLDSFKKGEFPVLVNCGVFTEGTDIPNIDCVLLARPTRSRNLLVQMIGRGMRLHPGKKNCHIIDMVASLAGGIVTTPTLFGLDPSELVEGVSPSDMMRRKERKERESVDDGNYDTAASSKPLTDRVVFTDYDSVFDLIKDTSGEKYIRAVSPHGWVCVGPDRYILSHSNGSFLNLDKLSDSDDDSSDDQYVVHETLSLKLTDAEVPFGKPRQIASAATFIAALHAADTYASQKYPYTIISKMQPWRNKPATEGQLNFLNKLRLKTDQLTADSLTKGQAVDMITKIKHGARGRFATMQAKRRKQNRVRLKLEQEQELKEREKVSVGPLLAE
ncbi:p-loop containing nucleoside triphosphate hydrolase protein [Venustampulla echinocandica]|uniref:p-loop containing nucleoside triphosphate hydrolase protein n=1 Tax=Venustampulla echinocandica TaxID=2656787 RepID=A0A370TJP0_9HELO|nr:p-loop containing nucleoside triphosphate hydrolase protein [Venustampulla echinocandica]RDL35735.1 p-loop containing nucleoside triphosphate hydrolase protein [Venustampulla echinocandica]